MRKTVISLLIVSIMISANFIGMIMFDTKDGIKDSLDNDDEDLILDFQEDNQESISYVPDKDTEKNWAEGEIPWHILSSDSNPSAKLFLDQGILAIEFRLPKMEFEKTSYGEIINLEGCDPLLEPGNPLVPLCKFFVAVPSGSEVKDLEIVEAQTRILEGNHIIAPYIPMTLDGQMLPIQANADVYTSSALFPDSVYEISGPNKLRHLDALEISLYPVRIRPAMETVEVCDLLRIKIELEATDGTQLAPPSVSVNDDLDRSMLKLIVNSGDVNLCTSYESTHSSSTRAPSTIYHTMGFHILANAIHPVKDTTVGNLAGVTLLSKNDDQYYVAEAGQTMYIDGFDIGSANVSASLDYAVLHLQYKGTDGYDGTSKVRWALEGDSLKETDIQPKDLNDTESPDMSYDLLGYLGSPSTVSDLADLDIEYSENGVFAGSKDIPFDYVWIEFAYREELVGESKYLIITNFALADELRPLAEFKTERLSVDTQVYDIEWIDDNWDGPNLLHRIRDFIRSMYENYSTEYILLGGDENIIPTNDTNSIYDSFYVDVNGWAYPDLAIGRLPTTQDDIMEAMVNDILAHQRDMRPWKRNHYLIGTNVFSSGDGQRDMYYIRDNSLSGHDLTFYEDYEIEGNVTRTRTINTYNLGMGTSTITGHGSKYGWYKNNGSQNFFNKNDVNNSLTNSDMRGFVWSSTCSSGGFVGSYVCIGEMWVIARDGGGIGYVGAAKIALYSSTKALYRGFWDAFDKLLDAGEDPTQGVCHYLGMNKCNYRIYVLFGDPQVGLTASDPNLDLTTGYFDSGNFADRSCYDQGEQVSIKTKIRFPASTLPRGVYFNLTIRNEEGDVFHLPEIFVSDPDDLEETIFWNWSIPAGAPNGVYNITFRIYNTSQGWESIYINDTYFFVGYNASIIWVEQVYSEVIEGDTVLYWVHMDNVLNPIPSATIKISLEGRDYDPYMTPFNYYGSNTTSIPTAMDFIVEVEIPVFEPGTYNVTAELYVNWAHMDSAAGDETEVRGIRILNVEFNHPIYFREDTVEISFHYFAFSDFTGDAILDAEEQASLLCDPCNFYNGTNWLNFTWTVPKFLPNDTYNLHMEVNGLGRSLETGTKSMRVVTIREILDKGERWLIPMQQPGGGWNESLWSWPPGPNYNETARVMQALLWSGMDQSDPVIQQAADYIEDSLNLSRPGRIDNFAQTIWAMVEAGRGSSPKIQDSQEVIRNMQNWIFEEENWTLIFNGNMNDTWLVNISGYDDGGGLLYSQEYSGKVNVSWGDFWVNFSVLPGTVTLNVTINTSAGWVNAFIFPTYFKLDPKMLWDGIRLDDSQGPGDGIKWNCTASEEFEFDRGWGRQKGLASLAGFTAWGVIGLLQYGVLGPFEQEAKTTGVEWLLDNQSADGSWYPIGEDIGLMGGGEEYPGAQAGAWAADPIQNTALPVIALVANGTLGQPVDDAVAFLKSQQAENGSYPFSTWSWDHSINVISTAHTLRALRRTGHMFEVNMPYVREGARWLCAAQSKFTGNWENWGNFTRVASEAMMALACIKLSRTMELQPGWNLISLSLIQEDTSLSYVLDSIDGDYDAVQWYDPTDSADSWKHHKVGKPNGNDLFNLNEEMGIWIHITNPAGATLRYNGFVPKRNLEIDLHMGWNLVGFPSQCYRNRTMALNNVDFGMEVDAILTYDAHIQKWIKVGELDYIEPEVGYYIHARTDITWEVTI
ncbi:MAG: hypothetical protein JSW00_14905 [Thermoplasmata archaeon]|nr:MAG: hypothetical protein JSW00_14905 [Thermoplasmata archaeon]